MAHGPQAGLTLVDALASEPSLARYHLLPSVRADPLYKLGRHAEARAEFERAAALTRNIRERDLLLTRAASCQPDPNNCRLFSLQLTLPGGHARGSSRTFRRLTCELSSPVENFSNHFLGYFWSEKGYY
jgi:hypothetical protein